MFPSAAVMCSRGQTIPHRATFDHPPESVSATSHASRVIGHITREVW